ncbi:hypothetical protein FBU59_000491 [Linderina macrospora]|uniref:Uncharacterized protein n=1 Tax=Linderina macrospora TaxID=4868 RepID=A0ACC1JGN7_9FUNG|nr:hypothetical protein FBU59_000491 [Linderina macrospora]
MFRSVLTRLPQPLMRAPTTVARRYLRVGPNAVRLGQVIDYQGSPQIVVGKDHGGTGRGAAVIKLSMKHAVTGARSQVRFRGSDEFDVMTLIQQDFQYLYSDETQAHLMDMQTFEELSMPLENFEGGKDKLAFLEDGMDVVVQVLAPEPGPISWRLPLRHAYKVRSVEMRVAKDKGATYVPAILENGAKVTVPDFIKPGETIVVDTTQATYVSRA